MYTLALSHSSVTGPIPPPDPLPIKLLVLVGSPVVCPGKVPSSWGCHDAQVTVTAGEGGRGSGGGMGPVTDEWTSTFQTFLKTGRHEH
ncbi:hypothetical protein HaLaN_09065 [Haematococcus lacustris]|uniref:Uncharacterized protein n=1 Tax=Haematococcus lacustris TaxID=44745 RepID=A0A699YVF2_HAELA|nr:hypothetical protein HaLaN_09065 [Haematococcus lacustris]